MSKHIKDTKDAVTREFALVKVTKRTVRYDEVVENDKELIGGLYVKQWWLRDFQDGGQYPGRISVTIAPMTEV